MQVKKNMILVLFRLWVFDFDINDMGSHLFPRDRGTNGSPFS
jgi:hypothetical protein